MLMPQIPLDFRTDLDKAMSVVSALKLNFALIVVFSRLTIVIRKKTPSYRKDKMGVTEEFYPEFSMFSKNLRLRFRCEEESGLLHPGFFNEDTVKTLAIAFTHPEQFDIFSESPKNRWQIGVLSKII